MLNGKTLMLLLGGVVLSGCGPEPSDPQGNNPAELKQEQAIQKENSAQAGDDTVQKRQAEAAQQAAKKQPNIKRKLKPKPWQMPKRHLWQMPKRDLWQQPKHHNMKCGHVPRHQKRSLHKAVM